MILDGDGCSVAVVKRERKVRKWMMFGVMVAVASMACGGGGDEGGFGVYESSIDDADFTFTIPAPVDSPEVFRLETYRQDVGADPVTYVLASGVNSGDESRTIPTISVVTDDGASFSTVIAWQVVGDWQELASDRTFYNRGVDLYNDFLRTDDLLPGARSTTVLIAEGAIPTVKSVFVERNLIEALEAFTESGGQPKPIKANKVSAP
jgi:hypothetical protein